MQDDGVVSSGAEITLKEMARSTVLALPDVSWHLT